MAIKPFTGAQNLRAMLADPNKLITCPGVFDGLTARIALSVGFDGLYMTGAGTSMSKLGWADLGMATLNDMHENAAMIASLEQGVPLIADADTGYGGPIMVSRTITKYAHSGVAALHIEDQVQQKRCGHLMGKEIVSREEYYSRLHAAVSARNELQSDMCIIARTDSRQSLGFDEAVERLQEAVRIGVDIVFLEALQSREECEKVTQIFKGTPMLLNMVPGGVTPWMTAAEAKKMGFKIMIFPGATIEPIIQAVTGELRVLRETGTTSVGKFDGGIHAAFNACGLKDCVEIDKKAGGKAYATVNEKNDEAKKNGTNGMNGANGTNGVNGH